MKVSLKITVFQNFGSIFAGKSGNGIKVQPTAVSHRRSKNGSRQKQSNVKTKTLPIRPVKIKRKYDITAAIDSNVPSAKKGGRSMVSNIKHFNRKETWEKQITTFHIAYHVVIFSEAATGGVL